MQSAVQRARQWLADGAPALEQVHDIFASYVSLAPLHTAMQAAAPHMQLTPPAVRLPSARGAAAFEYDDTRQQEERRQASRHAGPSGAGRQRTSHGRVVIAVATDAGEPPAELQGNMAVLEQYGCASLLQPCRSDSRAPSECVMQLLMLHLPVAWQSLSEHSELCVQV